MLYRWRYLAVDQRSEPTIQKTTRTFLGTIWSASDNLARLTALTQDILCRRAKEEESGGFVISHRAQDRIAPSGTRAIRGKKRVLWGLSGMAIS